MILPRPVLATLAALSVMAVAAGLILGWRVTSLTETDVINAAATRYISDYAGRPEDCVAQPGTQPVWIDVICGPGPARVIYQADRLGRITEVAPADPTTAAKELGT